MKVSLDDGITWINTESVKIKVIKDVDSNGENIVSEIDFSFTNEELITVVWIDNVCEGISSHKYEDIGNKLVS